MKQERKLLSELRISLIFQAFFGCLSSSKTYFWGTFAKNLPLTIKIWGGGYYLGGGFFIRRKGLYKYTCMYIHIYVCL